jgi:hypothetical protein
MSKADDLLCSICRYHIFCINLIQCRPPFYKKPTEHLHLLHFYNDLFFDYTKLFFSIAYSDENAYLLGF